ncbi:MAG: hypothetical protein ACI8P7_000670, partial [Candidatus Azotimanducaceae bacterium]
MNKIKLLSGLLLLTCTLSFGQDQLFIEDFEGTRKFTTINEVDDNFYYFTLLFPGKTDPQGSAYQEDDDFANKTKYWATNQNETADGEGTVSFNGPLDISNYDKVTLDVDWAVVFSSNWNRPEDYARVQYRLDGGSWVNGLNFTTNGGNNVALTEVSGVGGSLDQDGPNENFKKILTGLNNSTIEVRVKVFLTNIYVTVAFDNFKIIGECTKIAPTITESNFSFCPGDEFTLNSENNPSGLYQWYRDALALGGETGQSITASVAGDYTVEFPDQVCNKVSDPVTATAFAPQPKPDTYPSADQFICSDGTFTFDTDAGDNYQWFLGGDIIPIGGNAKTYDASQSGAYKVEVTNSDGCSAISDEVNLLLYPTPTKATITSSDADDDVFGHCAGNVFTLVSTTAAGYQWKYQGSNVTTNGNNQTLEIVGDGTYSIVTTDANGCTIESDPIEVYVLDNPPLPVVQANGPTTFCEGDQVRLSSDQTEEGYLWYKGNQVIDGATGKTLIVTESGNYKVETFNQYGCGSTSSTKSVTVNPNPNKATIVRDGPISFCPGGDLTLSITEAAVNYKWYWDGVKVLDGVSETAYTADSSGLYWAILTNEFGCTTNSDTLEVRVYFQEPAEITADGPVTFCEGGDVTLTSNYEIGNQWFKNGTAISGVTTQNFVAIASGDYHVEVSIEGCSDVSNVITVTVNANPAKPTIDQGDTTICNGSSITLTSSAVNGNQWIKDNVSIVGATFQSYEASTSGLYSVEVTNASGCKDTSDQVEILVNFEEQPTISPSDEVICEGEELTLVSSEVLGNQWYRNNVLIGGADDQSYTTGEAGTYHVIVSREGCSVKSKTASIQVNPIPTQPTISAAGSTTFCRGDSVLLSSNTYDNYKWYIDGTLLAGEINKDFMALAEGEYTVVHTNEFDCTNESSAITVAYFDSPRMTSVFTTDNTCNGLAEGEIEANSTGGIGNIEYSIDDIGYKSNNVFTGLSAGDYMVYVRDGNGCKDSLEATVNNSNTSLNVQAVKDQNITCNDDNDGMITATAGGGTGAYNYSIVGDPNSNSDGIFTSLPSGCYVIRVEDNGCEAFSDTLCIVNPEELEIVAQLDNDISCNDDDNAQISAFGAGGTGVYEYSINGVDFQEDNFFAFLSSGTYIITIRDVNGCFTESDPIVVTNPEVLTFNSITKDTDVECFGETTGQISVSVNGGTKPYTFRAGVFPFQNDSVIRNLPAGFYTISILDANGCPLVSGIDTVEITSPPKTVGTVRIDTNVACYDEETGILTVVASGGTGTLRYSVDGGGTYQNDSTFTDLRAKAYEVYVTDENNCEVFLQSVTITQPLLYAITATLDRKISCTGAGDAKITGHLIGGTGPVLIRLNEGTWGVDTVFDNLDPGVYTVSTLDSIGCLKTSEEIVIEDPVLLTITYNKE